MKTDNSCAAGIANGTVKQRRSKAIDMRFYWGPDRVQQNHFVVHWRRGADNLADYFTNHHSPAHHRLMRGRYLLDLHRPTPPILSSEGVLIQAGHHKIQSGPQETTEGYKANKPTNEAEFGDNNQPKANDSRSVTFMATVSNDQRANLSPTKKPNNPPKVNCSLQN
jgi:hypothetical protein